MSIELTNLSNVKQKLGAMLGYLILISGFFSGHQSAFLSQAIVRNEIDRKDRYNGQVICENTNFSCRMDTGCFVSHPGEMVGGWGSDFQHTTYYPN